MPRTTVITSSELVPPHIVTALVNKICTQKQAAEKLGITKKQLFRRLAKQVSAGAAPRSILDIKSVRCIYDTLDQTFLADEKTATAQQAQTTAIAKLRNAEAEISDLRRLLSVIDALDSAQPEPPEFLTDDDAIPGLVCSSVPVLMLADWHIGERVNRSESYGYEYNVKIAERRVSETVKKSISLLRRNISGVRYPGMVLACVGDFVSGSIHAELAESDELEILPSIIKARDLLIGVIDAMQKEFGKVFVPCATGNHGRIFDRRPRAKGYAERNADFMIYQLLKSHYKENPNVTIVAPKSGETIFKIFDQTFLLTHGDMLGAKGGDGVIGAIGPIMRGQTKTLKSLATLDINIDHIIMGHYHHQLYLPRVTVSGCLKGPDEYATRMLRAPVEDPTQTLMLVHPERGIWMREPIFLRDESCPSHKNGYEKTKSWVTVFENE